MATAEREAEDVSSGFQLMLGRASSTTDQQTHMQTILSVSVCVCVCGGDKNTVLVGAIKNSSPPTTTRGGGEKY